MGVPHNKLYKWNGTKEVFKTAEAEQEMGNLLEPNASVLMEHEEQGGQEALLQDARQAAEENMPPSFAELLSFRTKLDGDKPGYQYSDDGRLVEGKRRTKSTGYMRNIIIALGELERLLSQTADTSKEAADGVQDAFYKVIAACDTYIEKRTGFFAGPWTAEGKARKQIVEDFREQVAKESVRFSDRVNSLRAEKVQQAQQEGDILEDIIKEEQEEKSWLDIIGEIRTEKYVDGEDGVKVTEGGVGTSKLYIIEKDGKKQFFKESEKVPSQSCQENLREQIDFLHRQAEDASLSEKQRNTSQRQHGLMVKIRETLEGADTDFRVSDHIAHLTSGDEVYRYVMEKMGANNPLEPMRTNYLAFKREIRQAEQYRSYYQDQAQNAPTEEARKEAQQYFEYYTEQIASYQSRLVGNEYEPIRDMLWNMRKNIVMNILATETAKIDKTEEISKRNVATSRLAKLFGIEDMIMESGMAEITINGKKMRGVRMEEVKGDALYMYQNNLNMHAQMSGVEGGAKITYSTTAIKQLLTLQVFDIICGQIDRSDSNYFGELELKSEDAYDYEATKIKSIDNDLCLGNLSYEDIKKKGRQGYHEARNIENNGQMTLPAIDKRFADAILAVTPDMINYQLADVLKKEERQALIDRLKGVQRIISKQMAVEAKAARKKRPISRRILESKEDWDKKAESLRKDYGSSGTNNPQLTSISYLQSQYL